MKRILTIVIASALLFACKKEGYEDLPTEPEIAIVSIHPGDTVLEFVDSVVVTISFQDGDGNLGRVDPEENSLYIKDERLPVEEYYHVPPIIPSTVNALKTRGHMRVFIPSLFILGKDEDFETTRIAIKVRDQEGNWSNEVLTPRFVILPNE